jgi:hypothetical protein
VQAGTLDAGKAYAINALINTRLRTIELERKICETAELEARLEALEAAQAPGNTRWG